MEQVQNNTPNPMEHSHEPLFPVSPLPSPANSHHMNGFGGNRCGFNNLYRLDRDHYPYPPPARRVNHNTANTACSRPGMMDHFTDIEYQQSRASLANTPRVRARSALALMYDYARMGYQQSRRASVALPPGADMMVENGDQEAVDDCLMTTPDSSRNASLAGQNGAYTMRHCMFGQLSYPQRGHVLHDPTIASGPRPLFNSAGIANTLNSMSSSPFDACGHRPSWIQPSAPTNHTPSQTNSQLPAPPPNPHVSPPSPSYSTSPASALCPSSPSPSIADQRYFHIITLHDVCLKASATHLSSLRHHRRISSWRYHPYSALPYHSVSYSLDYSRGGGRERSGGGGRSGDGDRREASLMDNISAICTHMWRKARNDGMAPHRAEADAVRGMRDLYAWGEVVVRGLGEGGEGDVDKGSVDCCGREERESEEGWHREESEAVRVGEAAKRLCRWFGERRMWETCEDVLERLRGLEERVFEREMRGENVSETTIT